MPRPTTGRVLQIQSNEIVRIWNSQAEIVRECGYKNPMISRAINTGCSAYGSYWRKENPEFKGRIFPQVGDMWRSLGSCKKYILATSKNAVRFLAIGSWGCHPKIIVQNIDTFMRIATYLGKSKVKIEDLFKTENE